MRARTPALAASGLLGLAVVVTALVLGQVVPALLAVLLTGALLLLVLLPGRLATQLARRVREEDVRASVAADRALEERHAEVVGLLAGLLDEVRLAGAAAAQAVEGAERVAPALAETREELSATTRSVAELRHQRPGAVDASVLRQELGFAVRAVGVDTWSLLRLDHRLGPETRLLSPGRARGWAATAETVLALVEDVLSRPAGTSVVECGSGTSTCWLAAAARRSGARVTALEHSPLYAARTRAELDAAGLTGTATVLDAPLAPAGLRGHETPWYGGSLDALPDTVDVLFVDGPPGGTGPFARYPAFPLLEPYLADGASVVLDDTDRAEELELVERWVADSDGRLVVTGRTDRATLMVYDRARASGRVEDREPGT